MNRRTYLIAAIIFLLIVVLFGYFMLSKKQPTVIIGDKKFQVLIADSESERIQGLSGRSSLKENEGMLFLYPQATTATFWMKDMQFDLDFIFIRNGIVVDLAEEIVSPEGDEPPETISTSEKFDAALEVPAGTVQRLTISIGDIVTYSL